MTSIGATLTITEVNTTQKMPCIEIHLHINIKLEKVYITSSTIESGLLHPLNYKTKFSIP
jgi:hypothetical protein